MKVQVEFITARLGSKLLLVEAIQDSYTYVQLSLNICDLDEVSIEAFREDTFVTETVYDTFYLGECEAKDVRGKYGNVVIAIESRTIDFE